MKGFRAGDIVRIVHRKIANITFFSASGERMSVPSGSIALVTEADHEDIETILQFVTVTCPTHSCTGRIIGYKLEAL